MTSEYIKDTTENSIERTELLHRRFITGLKEDYGMTDEEVLDVEHNWFYCGHRCVVSVSDDVGKLFRYYFPNEDFPEFSNSCVCRQKLLVRNDWITNGIEVLIIGQCCKDMFIINRLKTCLICKQSHRNRTDNYCNNCRDKIKSEKMTCCCGNKKKDFESECQDCYILSEKCNCGKNKKRGFKQCYGCFQGKKHVNTLTSHNDARVTAYLLKDYKRNIKLEIEHNKRRRPLITMFDHK